jgi:phosphatidylinositol glycan class P protein
MRKDSIQEYYGFLIYLLSFLVVGIYLIWAFVPDTILLQMGVHYLTDKYWAVVWPAWHFISLVFVYILFNAYNMSQTPTFDSYYTITDEHAHIESWIMNEQDPTLHDLPINVVNQQLYMRT